MSEEDWPMNHSLFPLCLYPKCKQETSYCSKKYGAFIVSIS